VKKSPSNAWVPDQSDHKGITKRGRKRTTNQLGGIDEQQPGITKSSAKKGRD